MFRPNCSAIWSRKLTVFGKWYPLLIKYTGMDRSMRLSMWSNTRLCDWKEEVVKSFFPAAFIGFYMASNFVEIHATID